jgi:cytochrome c biogenesis protein CcmG/thiol:disulfide interchange protein DsbE
LQGKPFDLENLRGRVVVITVMASWCAPCRAELPELAAAAERFAPRDVQIVGLAMRDDPHDALALLRESNADRLLVVADPDGIRAVGLGARGVPETFVVDRDGKLRLHALGPITEQWLDKYLPMPAVT